MVRQRPRRAARGSRRGAEDHAERAAQRLHHGPTNFVIIMWLQSLADVMNIEVALQQKVPGIELVESVVMLSTVKRVGWMLNPDSRASGAVVVPAQGFDEAD